MMLGMMTNVAVARWEHGLQGFYDDINEQFDFWIGHLKDMPPVF